jgi:hypothetical protein
MACNLTGACLSARLCAALKPALLLALPGPMPGSASSV